MCSNNGDVAPAALSRRTRLTLLPTFLVGLPPSPPAAWCRFSTTPLPPDLGIHALYAPNRYLAAKHPAQYFWSPGSDRKLPWDAFRRVWELNDQAVPSP